MAFSFEELKKFFKSKNANADAIASSIQAPIKYSSNKFLSEAQRPLDKISISNKQLFQKQKELVLKEIISNIDTQERVLLTESWQIYEANKKRPGQEATKPLRVSQFIDKCALYIKNNASQLFKEQYTKEHKASLLNFITSTKAEDIAQICDPNIKAKHMAYARKIGANFNKYRTQASTDKPSNLEKLSLQKKPNIERDTKKKEKHFCLSLKSFI